MLLQKKEYLTVFLSVFKNGSLTIFAEDTVGKVLLLDSLELGAQFLYVECNGYKSRNAIINNMYSSFEEIKTVFLSSEAKVVEANPEAESLGVGDILNSDRGFGKQMNSVKEFLTFTSFRPLWGDWKRTIPLLQSGNSRWGAEERNEYNSLGFTSYFSQISLEGIELQSVSHLSRIGSTGGITSFLSENILEKIEVENVALNAGNRGGLAGYTTLSLKNFSEIEKRKTKVTLSTWSGEIFQQIPLKNAGIGVNARSSFLGTKDVLSKEYEPTRPLFFDIFATYDVFLNPSSRLSFWGIIANSKQETEGINHIERKNLSKTTLFQAKLTQVFSDKFFNDPFIFI